MSVIPSAERVVVSAETVSRLVSEQFPPWASLGVQPVAVSGWDNHTFHLGQALKVRLPASSVYLSQNSKETDWLPRLAPLLPFQIPTPLGVGRPGHGYPFEWSVWNWIVGETATQANIGSMQSLANDIAGFLNALAACPTSGAPPAGPDNFFRGGNLSVYDSQVRTCLAKLQEHVDVVGLEQIWLQALRSSWEKSPQWVHGDIAWGNLLMRDGRLQAVIDFGSSAIGDPACDLVINWTLFDLAAREAFTHAYDTDPGTWARARGWCIWKAMLTLSENMNDPVVAHRELAVLNNVLQDVVR